MKKSMKWLAALLVLALALTGCGAAEAVKEAVKAEERAVTAGVVADGVYTNEYVGVRFTAPEWTMLGAQDLQNDLEDVNELLKGTEVGDAMAKVEQFMDLQAADPTQMMNVNVVYTKMKPLEAARYADMDEGAIIDETLEMTDAMMESYAAAGIEVESIEKATLFYAGQDHASIKMVGSIQGIPCYMAQVIDCKAGAYNVVTTIMTIQEDRTAEVAEMFENLNA